MPSRGEFGSGERQDAPVHRAEDQHPDGHRHDHLQVVAGEVPRAAVPFGGPRLPGDDRYGTLSVLRLLPRDRVRMTGSFPFPYRSGCFPMPPDCAGARTARSAEPACGRVELSRRRMTFVMPGPAVPAIPPDRPSSETMAGWGTG